MKFNSLKEFWEWLTISTGDVVTDHKAINAYMDSKDWDSLTGRQKNLFRNYCDIICTLNYEQQELELK